MQGLEYFTNIIASNIINHVKSPSWFFVKNYGYINNDYYATHVHTN